MFRLAGKSVKVYFLILAVAYGIVSFIAIVFNFKHGSFVIGILMAVSLLMIGLGSVKVPFVDQKVFPIIPKVGFWVIVSVVLLLFSGSKMIVGKDLSSALRGNHEQRTAQSAADLQRVVLSPGKYYDKKGRHKNPKDKLTTESKGFFLNEKSVDPDRETLLKVRMGDSVEGEIAWFPVSRVTFALVGQTLAGNQTSKSNLLVDLTGSEVEDSNMAKNRKNKDQFVFFIKGANPGDTIFFKKDFTVKLTNPDKAAVYVFNQLIQGEKGRKTVRVGGDYLKILAGSSFKLPKGQSPWLSVFVKGQITDYGPLKISKG